MTGPAGELEIRLGVIAAVAVFVAVGRAGLRAWTDWRRRRALSGPPAPELAQGQATVLLFTGTLCSDCETQKRVLQSVRSGLTGWRVREVQAAREQPLATRFGVESVPATVVLGHDGRSVAVNYGLVEADVLMSQLRPLLIATPA